MQQTTTHILRVQSPAALHALLRSHEIDLSQWGRNDAKTMTDLWQELVAEEAYLQEPPLRRIVPGVVRLIIRHGNHLLIEVQQAFRDGRTRTRGIPPSETMRRGESYVHAARRCVEEELRVARSAVQVLEQTHQIHHALHRSRSYPGLHSHYTFHTVDVQVRGLPQEAFATEEYSPKDGALYVRNSWAWQPHTGAFAAPHEAYALSSRANAACVQGDGGTPCRCPHRRSAQRSPWSTTRWEDLVEVQLLSERCMTGCSQDGLCLWLPHPLTAHATDTGSLCYHSGTVEAREKPVHGDTDAC
jgi:hypothetical protein